MLRQYLIMLLFLALSCTKGSDDVIIVDPVSKELLRDRITAFADTIDNLSKASHKHESLLYSKDDYSFYVSRYVRNAMVSLYTEHGKSANYGTIENKYYLKGGEVVLFIHNGHNPADLFPYKTVRTFYNNGNVLYSDRKAARTEEQLKAAVYSINTAPHNTIEADMKKLDDALAGRDKFDLLFEGITAYPKAKYLVLSRNKLGSYHAALLIEHEDNLIKAITADPEKFQGRKLDVTWDMRDINRAVYLSGSLAD